MGNTPSKKIEGYGQLDSSHTEEQVLMTPDHRLASSGRSAKQSPWRAVETADRKIYFWNFETEEVDLHPTMFPKTAAEVTHEFLVRQHELDRALRSISPGDPSSREAIASLAAAHGISESSLAAYASHLARRAQRATESAAAPSNDADPTARALPTSPTPAHPHRDIISHAPPRYLGDDDVAHHHDVNNTNDASPASAPTSDATPSAGAGFWLNEGAIDFGTFDDTPPVVVGAKAVRAPTATAADGKGPAAGGHDLDDLFTPPTTHAASVFGH